MAVKRREDWRAASDMHVLREASVIRADAKRLKAAQARAAEEVKSLAPHAR